MGSMAEVLCALFPADERHEPNVRAALVLVSEAFVNLRYGGALAKGLLHPES